MVLHEVNELKRGLQNILVLVMWQKSEIILLDSQSSEQLTKEAIFVFFKDNFFLINVE